MKSICAVLAAIFVAVALSGCGKGKSSYSAPPVPLQLLVTVR
jgi:predicted component of type VI protein secretion system